MAVALCLNGCGVAALLQNGKAVGAVDKIVFTAGCRDAQKIFPRHGAHLHQFVFGPVPMIIMAALPL